jgi:TPR repeat protein
MRMLLSAALLLMLAVPRPLMADPVADGTAAYHRKDYATAHRLWRPLAERGNAGAQSNLGVLYATGRGVPKNKELAYMWFNIDNDKSNRDRVASMMITKAEQLTRDWRVK